MLKIDKAVAQSYVDDLMRLSRLLPADSGALVASLTARFASAFEPMALAPPPMPEQPGKPRES